jgi:hypothetical protein
MRGWEFIEWNKSNPKSERMLGDPFAVRPRDDTDKRPVGGHFVAGAVRISRNTPKHPGRQLRGTASSHTAKSTRGLSIVFRSRCLLRAMVRKCGKCWKTVNSWLETDIEDVIKYPYYACHGDMCTRRASQQSTMAQQYSAVTKEIVITPDSVTCHC